MSALLPADIERFGKFLGLLGSDHDGERAAAARKATDFLQARKLGWPDVTNQLRQVPVVIQQDAAPQCHQADARRCLASGYPWHTHERKFLSQIADQRRRPSDKQRDWLEGLVDRLARKTREGSDVDF